MRNKRPNNKDTTLNLQKNILSFGKKIFMSEYFILYLSIAYFIVFIPFNPKIITAANIANLSSNLWPLLIIAIGQTFVLLLGGIDLSQVSVIGVTSVIGGAIVSQKFDPSIFDKTPLWGWAINENGGVLSSHGYAVPLAFAVMLLAGILIGMFNGFFIAKFKMPPFMVTLVSQMLLLNFSIFLTKSRNIMNLPQSFINFGTGSFLYIPYAAIFAGVIGVIAYFILARLVLGKWIYATGANPKASMVSGVPVDKVTIFVYSFSGFCGAAGSILYSSRMGMGRPTLGEDIMMDIIGATVIGGTSMFGGKGKVSWTLFGVIFFILLFNSLNLMNISYYFTNIVKGAVILAAALLDVVRTDLAKKTTVIKVGE